MTRLLIICSGTIVIATADLDGGSVFSHPALYFFNLAYLGFLFVSFTQFLYALSRHGSKTDSADIAMLLHDVWSLLYEDIHEKYAGKLTFMGRFTDPATEIMVYIEMLLVCMSVYGEIRYLIYLAS